MQRFDHRAHPPGIGVKQLGLIGHQPNVTGKEDEVSSLKFIRIDGYAESIALLV